MLLNQNQKLLVVKFETPSNQEPINNHQSNEVKMNLNLNQSNGNKKLFAKLLLIKDGQKKIIYLSGKNASTIVALKKVKNQGLRTLEAIAVGLPRISSYVHLLRHEDNINILTIRESNRKGRYILIDRIEILKTNDANFDEVVND